MKWFPWTYVDTYNADTGRFRSRRKFGPDGWAYKDLDTSDNHKPYDHVHDIQKGNRATDRKPNRQERKKFEKAKKKEIFIMLDLTKYNFDDDDITFLVQTEDWCINGQSEIILEYKGKSFVLEPYGKAVRVYAYGEVLGDYESFDDLLLNHKIDGKPLIELVEDLEYGD